MEVKLKRTKKELLRTNNTKNYKESRWTWNPTSPKGAWRGPVCLWCRVLSSTW